MTDLNLDKIKSFDIAFKIAKKTKKIKQKNNFNKPMNDAYKYITELLSGFFVGGIIGWLIDIWLGTKPLFFIIFIFIGAITGILNMIKSSVIYNNKIKKINIKNIKY